MYVLGSVGEVDEHWTGVQQGKKEPCDERVRAQHDKKDEAQDGRMSFLASTVVVRRAGFDPVACVWC